MITVNIFINFVKFLGWIIIIWMKLSKIIEEKGSLGFWKEAQLQK